MVQVVVTFVFFFLVLSLPASAAPVKKRMTRPSPSTSSRSVTERSVVEPEKSPLSGTMVRPLFGFAFQNPKALNSQLEGIFNNNSGIRVGTATNWGVAADYPVVADTFYTGLRIESFSGSSSPITISNNNKGTAQASLSGLPVMFTTTLQTPVASRFNVGGSIGAGVAFNYKAALEFSASDDPVNAPNGTLAYSTTPFCGLGSAFASYDFSRHIGLRFETGYRLLSSDQLRATDKYAGIKEGEMLVDDRKTNVKVDGNAFYTGLSLQVTL